MKRESDKNELERVGASRRDFVKVGVAGAVGLTLGPQVGSAVQEPAASKSAATFNPRTHLAMPMRNLGRTGYRTGIFSLGGQATIEQKGKEEESIAIINRAIDLGVNYIDTAARYGGPDQWSQKYIGKVMKTRRHEVWLSSKTHDRTYDGSMKLLEGSLQQLNTDHLDLWQLHNIQHNAELDQIFGKDGAIHAMEKAREQKMVRFLGITGHFDPNVLMEGLRRYKFDTILMALNAADPHHMSFKEKLLPTALEQQLGIIGMKIPARGRILANWTPPPSAGQQPASGTALRSGTLQMKEALGYVLSLPVSTVIIGCDNVAQLEENVQIAREFTPLTESKMAELTAKTEEVKQQALFFRKWA
jgi:aryl-alcohol dehydrogenase-like predicted oxidoreductase